MKKTMMIGVSIALLSFSLQGAEQPTERRLSVETYRDKMKAGWVGQIVGVCWGAPTEFKFNDKIIPEEKVPQWEPSFINNAFGQDDLYVEMTFLRTLEQYGLNADIRQAGIDFANSEYPLWCANLAGRNNLRKGIAPPDSSHPKYNKCPNDIDYQIEADFSGLISPGMPVSVINLGNTFGRLMNYGDGVYGGQFMGGMYAEAFFTADREQIIQAGLACIPAESQYAEMVRDLLRWYKEDPKDWKGCWQKCLQKYRKNPAYQKDNNGGIDVKINGAMILLGYLYGEGDIEKTITISMRGGYDSDCNPSSAAGVLFTSIGFQQLPPAFCTGLNQQKKFSFTEYTIPNLLDVCEKLARDIVKQQGGRIEKDAQGKEFFVLPAQSPNPGAYQPSWQAPPPAGTRFTEEECKKIKHFVNLPDATKFEDPNPTIRVQKTLDACFPGWKSSRNGPDMQPGYLDQYLNEYLVCSTHPPKRGEPVILTREITLPEGDPTLNIRVANAKGGNFKFIVRINGKNVMSTDLVGEPHYHDFTIGLFPWARQNAKIEVIQQPTDWMCEAAYWRKLEISTQMKP